MKLPAGMTQPMQLDCHLLRFLGRLDGSTYAKKEVVVGGGVLVAAS